MKYPFEADIYRTLCAIAKKGLLIERSKPVYWSWAAKTALAEAEVEYEDKEDFSIYVAFELEDDAKAKLGASKAALVIWTTTPWTLPSNMGISLHPEEEYVLTSDGFIVAKARYENMIEEEVLSGTIAQTFKGEVIENMFAINPLNKRKSELGERLHLLARLGEDWQNEKAEIEYYRAQSSWALIKFCWKEESREFEIEKMLKSDLLNNKGW